MDPVQNPLFREPLGTIFRTKREQLGLSIEDAAKSLKFGAHLVDAIEHEQWEKLGAPVFAKSYINSYIKLLGLNEAIRDEIPNLQRNPTLKAITATKIEPAGRRLNWLFGLISVAAVVAVVAYFSLRQAQDKPITLDNLIALGDSAKPAEDNTKTLDTTAIALPGQADPAEPAEPAALPVVNAQPTTAASVPELRIVSVKENWLEVRGKDNAVLFSGLMVTGQEYRQSIDKIGKITLGNANSAEITRDGQALDIRALVRDDIARFSLDDSGQPVALSQ